MRHASSNNRRPRNNRGGNPHRRSGGNGGGQGQSYNRNQVFDSNGPDVRIRGTAFQICEKYTALAKDANSVGDVVMAESYMQHAEHYQRIINTWAAEAPPQQAYAPQANEQSEDDLGLPASILSTEIKVQDEAEEDVEQDERMLATA